ncbi:MAG: hypothetical protein KJS97_05215 [Alphaproteobacteria bacterium]|nr:hypothetical protein [Alphaproteobacteria bacterium]
MGKQVRRSSPVGAATRALRPPVVRPMQIVGLLVCAIAAWLAFAAARAEAFAALTAHAGWCIGGSEGAPPSDAATLFGHCALCWASAGAAFVGAAMLGAGARR